ncbi:Aminomethyltransferase folate-binding domain-containing protein [Rickenella mellea]|uniref:Aminomethyltransferase folate-binding domain-containing protein n=1 Tax=Rickenella mellea TaxID=50990 RepID=A0A4R5XG60_9AGAM|nr:Aminomethyltransferase folate-binding domain-containing protein [Rickenella mellea]
MRLLRPLLGIHVTPAVAQVPHRSLLYLSGSQASEFLNGVLATSVPSPSVGPFFSTFLHAQGRVLYDVFVYNKKNPKGQDGYFIEYDPRPSEAPPILPFLKRYILRSKVKIEDVSNEYDVWAAWGSERESNWETERHWNPARSGVVEPVWPPDEPWPWGTEEMELRDRRAVGMGKRMIVRKGERPAEASTHDLGNSDAYTYHRILHGVPEGTVDIPPMQAFPMESDLDVMGGCKTFAIYLFDKNLTVDFRKGCYVGQELTVRTYHTGAVRKRILPVKIEYAKATSGTPPSPPHHSDIKAVVLNSSASTNKPRPRGTGKLLSTCNDIALALLRLEHVEGAERGDLVLQVDAAGDENQQRWTLKPWWPEWWPQSLSNRTTK